ncbi:MAG: DNA methyltransferase, partial [Coriobacteriia bacterium]|nr:DNA methyltransferase [Coriobacteriia bacterium]
MEKRGGALFDIDREDLEQRMRLYFDPGVEWEGLAALGTGLTRHAAAFQPREVRTKALAAERFDEARILRYVVRPFEDRWAYYSSTPGLWNRARPTLFGHLSEDNAFVLSRVGACSRDEGVPLYFTSALSDDHLLSPDASCFTFLLPGDSHGELELESAGGSRLANLSNEVRRYLAAIGHDSGDQREDAGLIWLHALAIGYSLKYLEENEDGVKTDWPRIPLPATLSALESSAVLGASIAKTLDPGAPPFATAAPVRNVRSIGVLSSASGTLDPSTDLAVTARWGIAGKGGICMPSTGKLEEREYSSEELESISEAAQKEGLTTNQAVSLLGETCFDVYLNDVAYWRCVPSNVWR